MVYNVFIYQKIFMILSCVLTGILGSFQQENIEEFLREYNKAADKLQKDDTLASWNYESNMTPENKKETVRLSGVVSDFALQYRDKANNKLKNVGDDVSPSLIRQLKLITRTASSTDNKVSKDVAELISKMTSYYSKTEINKTILNENNQNESYIFKLNSELLPIMSAVGPDKLGNLRWAWRVWREAVGPKNKESYVKFVDLVNKGARENGFDDLGDYWRKEYEVDDLENMIEEILMEVMPLYKKLHAFTRYKLKIKILVDVEEWEKLLKQHKKPSCKKY